MFGAQQMRDLGPRRLRRMYLPGKALRYSICERAQQHGELFSCCSSKYTRQLPAPPPAPPRVPSFTRSFLQEYFHNSTTNETTWDRPTAAAAPKAAPPLPSKPSGEREREREAHRLDHHTDHNHRRDLMDVFQSEGWRWRCGTLPFQEHTEHIKASISPGISGSALAFVFVLPFLFCLPPW